MRTLLKFIKQLFQSEKDWVESYLGQSTDHADLERRIRELDRGEITVGPFGPHRKYYN